MTSIMTGIVLDSYQQTQPTLTTSLDKKGSQKPSFLDVSTNTTPFEQPFLDNSGVFDDNYHEDVIPPNLPIPPPLQLSLLQERDSLQE